MEDNSIDDDTKVAPNFTNEEILREVLNAMMNNSKENEPPKVVTSVNETPQAERFDKNADLIINSGNEKYCYYGDINDDCMRDGYGRTEMSNGKTAYEGNYKTISEMVLVHSIIRMVVFVIQVNGKTISVMALV